MPPLDGLKGYNLSIYFDMFFTISQDGHCILDIIFLYSLKSYKSKFCVTDYRVEMKRIYTPLLLYGIIVVVVIMISCCNRIDLDDVSPKNLSRTTSWMTEKLSKRLIVLNMFPQICLTHPCVIVLSRWNQNEMQFPRHISTYICYCRIISKGTYFACVSMLKLNGFNETGKGQRIVAIKGELPAWG